MKLSNKKYILITILISVIMLSGCSYIRFDTFNDADKTSESDNDLEDEDKDSNQNSVNNNKDENEVKKSTGTDNQTEMQDKVSAGDKTTVTPIPAQIQPIAQKELMIYSINANSADTSIDAVVAMVPNDEDITPNLIVEKVVEALADQSIIVGIDSVTTKDDIVIVSFKSDKAPLINVGASIEATILDAIAQSLIDNLEDYNKVIYRVEDKAYASGHIELKIDEVYLER